jgi:mRNA-degrading endonuclease RelE of RelBE toxin-antitoxin system
MAAARTWELASSSDFDDMFRKLTKKDKPLREKIEERLQRVEADPLCGDPKTGRYRSCRSIHVAGHFVLGWYLEPTIFKHDHIDKLQRVVFFFVGHHDDWSP